MLFALEPRITFVGYPVTIPSDLNVIIDCSQIINDAMERYDTVCITWYRDGNPIFQNTSLSEISWDRKLLYVFTNDKCQFNDGYKPITEYLFACEATQCLSTGIKAVENGEFVCKYCSLFILGATAHACLMSHTCIF